MKRQEIKKNYKRTKIKVEKKWHCHGNNHIHSKENQTILLVGCKKENILTLKFVLYWCMDSCVRYWSISFRILLMTIKESNKQLKNVYFYERQF